VLTCDATRTGRFPVNAGSTVLADASLVFRTASSQLFGKAPSRQGELNLTILYGTGTSNGAEPVWELNATFLQIGNFTLPAQGYWTFCVSGDESEQWFESGGLAGVKSLLTTVPGQGNYSIFAEQEGLVGSLRPSSGASFVVSPALSFYASAQFHRATATATAAASPTPTAHFTVSFQAFFHPKKLWIFGRGWLVLALWD
jgi:hypothetical protein